MLTAAEVELAQFAVTQGLQYWNTFNDNLVNGSATRADLDAAFAKLDSNYELMVSARADQKAAEQRATAINAAGDTTGVKVPDGG